MLDASVTGGTGVRPWQSVALGAMQTRTVAVFPKWASSQPAVPSAKCTAAPGSPSSRASRWQGNGGFAKTVPVFCKFCRSLKTPKRSEQSGKASKAGRAWARLEEPLTQRSPPGRDRVFLSVKRAGVLNYYLSL